MHGTEWHDGFRVAWRDWVDVCSLDSTLAERWGERLIMMHGEPHRRYHTGAHILDLFARMKRLPAGSGFQRPQEAAAVAFLHDAIYRIGATENEERSAELADEVLTELGMDKTARIRIIRTIRATASHEATGEADTDLFLDLDMAILGDTPESYGRYRCDVMAEYCSVVPKPAYLTGRIELFILPTLAKDRIFVTSAFAGYEAQARANLKAERIWLEDGAGAQSGC